MNRLVSAPIPGLVRELAIPASTGFFFNTMYNVADTWYAGHYSTEALAALSLSFPIFFILFSTGSGFSTGASALIGNALGKGDRREAALTAAQGVILSLLVAVMIISIGFVVTPTLYRLLGATDQYLQLCLDYMQIILLGCVFVFLFFMFNGVLNSLGDTKAFRNYLMAATLANIILDPIFMYGWIGFPASLNMVSQALGIFIITYFLSTYGQDVVAAYGAATRIEQIVLMPALGLNVAALSLAAQNGGAGRFGRVRELAQTCLRYGAVVMGLGTVLLFFGAEFLMSVFTTDAGVIATGSHYLRIAAFLEFAYVIIFVNTAILQGLKKPLLALWIGLYRQLIMPIGLFWMATHILDLGLNGIWWSIFGINWSAALVAIYYARRKVAHLEREAG